MKRFVPILVVICIVLCSFPVFAHSGRTDANGGHYDRSTGEYHYHHGYSAHQHPGGVCPYEDDPYFEDEELDFSGTTSPSPSKSLLDQAYESSMERSKAAEERARAEMARRRAAEAAAVSPTPAPIDEEQTTDNVQDGKSNLDWLTVITYISVYAILMYIALSYYLDAIDTLSATYRSNTGVPHGGFAKSPNDLVYSFFAGKFTEIQISWQTLYKDKNYMGNVIYFFLGVPLGYCLFYMWDISVLQYFVCLAIIALSFILSFFPKTRAEKVFTRLSKREALQKQMDHIDSFNINIDLTNASIDDLDNIVAAYTEVKKLDRFLQSTDKAWRVSRAWIIVLTIICLLCLPK